MYVKVRAKTGVKAESVRQVSKTHLEIAVKQKPLQNLANTRIIELVAAHFGASLTILVYASSRSNGCRFRKPWTPCRLPRLKNSWPGGGVLIPTNQPIFARTEST